MSSSMDISVIAMDVVNLATLERSKVASPYLASTILMGPPLIVSLIIKSTQLGGH
jgi:hypothetical protein